MIDLAAGWNLIGWPAETPIARAVAGLAGDFLSVNTYDAESDSFATFVGADRPAALNTLAQIASGDGVWVHVPAATTWERPEPRTAAVAPLEAGFNLAAWLGPNRTPAGEAIAAIAEGVRSVWSFEAETQTFSVFRPGGGPMSSDLILDYGQGLWVDMAAPAEWAQPAPYNVARQWNEELLSAIRADFPAPTVHARNLFHLSVAMYDAWGTYDAVSAGYLVREKRPTEGMSALAIEAAREEAISYAAYRLLRSRFGDSVGSDRTLPALDARMEALGFDRTATGTSGESPRALGNRIAEAVIAHGMSDGSNEQGAYADTTGYTPANLPLPFESALFDLPVVPMEDPNRWQPLAFDIRITQNEIELGESVQEFIGPHWGAVTPFALEAADGSDVVWSAVDPGAPPLLGEAGDAECREAVLIVIRRSRDLAVESGEMIDLSPSVSGNRSLGTHDDQGYAENPVTGAPYAPNVVPLADYGRVIAEFWADGPDSETPPGHWNVLANEVSADPEIELRVGGEGAALDALEWHVKLYLALNGAVHDAAIAGWGSKAKYDYSRPISMIRYMGELGQSSDAEWPSFHADGLPLEPGLVEVITAESSAPGERHEDLFFWEGGIAIFTWSSEFGDLRWIRAETWMPYQAATFVTPAFAAYVSGHSTFSRAAAEVMTSFTGSAFFPGGLGTFIAEAGEFLDFDEGPSVTVALQWATYFDAADEAGISRLYGGIHVPADDFAGRVMGATIGQAAFALAEDYFAGTAP